MSEPVTEVGRGRVLRGHLAGARPSAGCLVPAHSHCIRCWKSSCPGGHAGGRGPTARACLAGQQQLRLHPAPARQPWPSTSGKLTWGRARLAQEAQAPRWRLALGQRQQRLPGHTGHCVVGEAAAGQGLQQVDQGSSGTPAPSSRPRALGALHLRPVCPEAVDSALNPFGEVLCWPQNAQKIG